MCLCVSLAGFPSLCVVVEARLSDNVLGRIGLGNPSVREHDECVCVLLKIIFIPVNTTLSLQFVLTIDDGLEKTERKEINVF